ncbi:glycoside hydrolase [Cereibacter sphaeroides]|uniref:Glycoside hydrolase n=1 Tax=Cereibacter sphaeroides TaxID=1063 RepID=A0AAX1UMS3_CERSP|nr:glycoside hydrolase family 16 protein [Cereibacter sphaeroides]RHZ96448.1 glycoside hydrolase [Cereibacter sphaeroides]
MGNIDPDMQPILDGIAGRLAALEEVARPTREAVDLGPLTTRVVKLEAAFSAMAAALADSVQPETEPEAPADALPEGYRVMSALARKRGDEAGAWGATNNIVMTTWRGGAGTTGDPSLCDWRMDGSVALSYRNDGRRSGVLQVANPKFSSGRIGAMIEVLGANAVCAFFTYRDDTEKSGGKGKEFDFELIKRNGEVVWAIGIHMPKPGGGVVSSEKVYAPLKAGVHQYEIEHGDGFVAFYIDGERVAKFTPADVPGATWDLGHEMQSLFSVEWHQGWAGWSEADYATNQGKMRVLGYKG